MRLTLVVVVMAMCCGVSWPAAAATWTEVRTPHYVFIGDARATDMKRIAERFEQFHAVMERVLSHGSVSIPAPTIVLVFRDERSFRPYRLQYQGKARPVNAYVAFGSNLNYVAMTATGDNAYPVVFRALAHLITNNVAAQVPTWLAVGIAEYYSSFEMRDDDQALLGRPIENHVGLLREQFMPLRELLTADRTSPAYNEGNRAPVFYAESWALVHYLRSNAGTRERFNEFVTLAGRRPPEAALKEAFGLEIAALEKALRDYVHKYTMSYERWTFGAPVADARMSATEIDEATVLPHLAALLVHTGQLDEADRRLRAAAQAQPTSALVHATLAVLLFQRGQPTEGLGLLRRDLTSNGFLDDYIVASALARLISASRTDAREDQSLVALLRKRATTAAESGPNFAEAWRLAAFAHLLADEADQAAQAIARALKLAPTNEYYRFTQAEAMARRGDFARSRATLGELLARASTPELRAEARRMLASVAERENAARAAAEEAAASPPEPRSEEEPRPAASLPVFRTVEPGETRVFGSLTAIECGPGRVTLVVRTGERTLRVSVPSFERIELVSFRNDLQGAVTCAARTRPDPVYVTWRGADEGKAEIHAESLVVEFTPLGFTPP